MAKRRADKKAEMLANESFDNRDSQERLDKVSKIAEQNSAGKPKQNKLPPGMGAAAAAVSNNVIDDDLFEDSDDNNQ